MTNRNSGDTDSRGEVDRALTRLVTNTRVFVCETVRERFPDVLDRIPSDRLGRVKTIDDIATTPDATALLAILGTAWDQAFADKVKAPGVGFPLVDKVRNIRNEFSHDGERGFSADDIKAINDLRNALVAAAPVKPPPTPPPPINPDPRPRSATGSRRGSGARPGSGSKPAPSSGPRPSPPISSRSKLLRITIAGAFVLVAIVIGILVGVIVSLMGLSDATANWAWLCTSAFVLSIVREKLNVRGKRGQVLKYLTLVVFWFGLGMAILEAMRHLPSDLQGNWSAVPTLAIWVLGAILLLKTMISDRKPSMRR